MTCGDHRSALRGNSKIRARYIVRCLASNKLARKNAEKYARIPMPTAQKLDSNREYNSRVPSISLLTNLLLADASILGLFCRVTQTGTRLQRFGSLPHRIHVVRWQRRSEAYCNGRRLTSSATQHAPREREERLGKQTRTTLLQCSSITVKTKMLQFFASIFMRTGTPRGSNHKYPPPALPACVYRGVDYRYASRSKPPSRGILSLL